MAPSQIVSSLMDFAPPLTSNDTAAQSAQYLIDIAYYIASHDYTLVDYNGKVTTWGYWDPSHLISNRQWSDERGVGSLQILALISAAIGAAPMVDPPAEWMATLWSAWHNLTANNGTTGESPRLRQSVVVLRCVGVLLCFVVLCFAVLLRCVLFCCVEQCGVVLHCVVDLA